MITILDKWRHSGFNVYRGSRILLRQKKSMENPARYFIRASFSQERMIYLPGEASAKTGQQESGRVEYQSKDGLLTKTFDALEWLAAMCSHVPNQGEQVVRYYGYYSNANRDLRMKALTDDQIPYILESKLCSKEFRKKLGAADSEDQ